MNRTTWMVLCGMVIAFGAAAQQAPREESCPAGTRFVGGKCVPYNSSPVNQAPIERKHPWNGQTDEEPAPVVPAAPAASGGAPLPVCKGDEVVKDGKCVKEK
jgi:hypothetical protein